MFEGETGPASRDQADEADAMDDALSIGIEGSVAGGTGRGGLRLSTQQLAFAREYVLCGGNATKAAAVAGYTWPVKAGFRNLLNPAILHEIKRLSVVYTEALLPVAIRQLVEIMCNPELDAKARVQAANSLLDRGGMKPKGDGPSVLVNVQVNGSQAQAAIAEVWDTRSRRIQQERMSDIGDGMSDIQQGARMVTIDQSHGIGVPLPADGVGGVQSEGPVPATCSIPPYAPEHLHKTAGSPTWPDDPAEASR